jgi:hypothetical protein
MDSATVTSLTDQPTSVAGGVAGLTPSGST